MVMFKEPKNSQSLVWTKHSKEKMRYYQLSESRLKRVLKNPKRVEKGIAPNTTAIMQLSGTKKHQTEIWLMYQVKKSKIKSQKHAPYRPAPDSGGGVGSGSKVIKIISAWRYPGISPIHEPPHIPEDVLKDLKEYGI